MKYPNNLEQIVKQLGVNVTENTLKMGYYPRSRQTRKPEGVALLIETTPAFFKQEDVKKTSTDFSHLLKSYDHTKPSHFKLKCKVH